MAKETLAGLDLAHLDTSAKLAWLKSRQHFTGKSPQPIPSKDPSTQAQTEKILNSMALNLTISDAILKELRERGLPLDVVGLGQAEECVTSSADPDKAGQ